MSREFINNYFKKIPAAHGQPVFMIAAVMPEPLRLLLSLHALVLLPAL